MTRSTTIPSSTRHNAAVATSGFIHTQSVDALTDQPGPQQPRESLRNAIGRHLDAFWLAAYFATGKRFPGLVRVLCRPGCWFLFHCSAAVRKATLGNAARILGLGASAKDRQTLARGVVRNFYLFALDVARCCDMSRNELLNEIETVQGTENWDAARSAGGGMIVVTAHMGSFEVGLAALTERMEKVHVIFRRDVQGGFEKQRSALRRRLNVIECSVDDGWAMWVSLRDALTAGGCVVFQGDRVMPGQKGRRVPFLHGHLELPTGPIKLARLTHVPIVPIFAIRLPDGRVRLHIEPPIFPDEEANGAADPALARLATVLESFVRRYSDQWLMFHPAFCEDADPRRASLGPDDASHR